FHYEPYELRWQPPHKDHDVKVHGELFTSAAFLEAHMELQDSPPEPDCDLPHIIAVLMFWSDSTQLTTFGNTKLWPLYVYFGNESKYQRSQPENNLCCHAAYFQMLPNEFKDFLTEHFGGNGPSEALFTHCHRELFHEQWKILLDEDFIKAYKHGIIITCCNSIKCQFYPQIFTYSADYPEKILIASIRNLSTCPRPRCTITMARVPDVATEHDMLQRQLLIHIDSEERRKKGNYAVNTPQNELLLKDESLVPTSNAFSDRLCVLGFNLFSMLVVDLMHEFELSIWKAIFTHLLRMLESLKDSKLHELDRR
ncbi:hypothetical protein PAXINDRAFT_40354, partial [Paxillus involutus ATCC 200175]